MASYKVGGEVDAFCTRCKLLLAHTILAVVGTKIARVRCNTCGGDHAFKADASAAAKPRSTPVDRAEKQIISFEGRLAGIDLAKVPPYSAKRQYTLGEVLHHPTFGYGIVSAVRGDKVDVDFKASVRTLVHAREGAAAARPAYQPPHAGSQGPSDKPGSEPPE